MRRVIPLVCVLFSCYATIAHAGLRVEMDGLGTTYTPGETFSFVIVLDGPITALHLYDLNLQVQSQFTQAVGDIELVSVSQASSNYVFGAGGVGFTEMPDVGTVPFGLNITDELADGAATVDIASGASANLADVTLRVKAGVNLGTLTFGFNTDTMLLLDSSDENITQYDDVISTAGQVSRLDPATAVPEPSSLMLMLASGACGAIGWSATRARRSNQPGSRML